MCPHRLYPFIEPNTVVLFQVSGLTSSMQLIYVQADLCDTRDSKLADNMDLMRNITK